MHLDIFVLYNRCSSILKKHTHGRLIVPFFVPCKLNSSVTTSKWILAAHLRIFISLHQSFPISFLDAAFVAHLIALNVIIIIMLHFFIEIHAIRGKFQYSSEIVMQYDHGIFDFSEHQIDLIHWLLQSCIFELRN